MSAPSCGRIDRWQPPPRNRSASNRVASPSPSSWLGLTRPSGDPRVKPADDGGTVIEAGRICSRAAWRNNRVARTCAAARGGRKRDQDQAVDIPQFPFRKQGNNGTEWADRQRLRASTSFAAASASGRKMCSFFVPVKAGRPTTRSLSACALLSVSFTGSEVTATSQAVPLYCGSAAQARSGGGKHLASGGFRDEFVEGLVGDRGRGATLRRCRALSIPRAMCLFDPVIRITATHPLARGPGVESIPVGTPQNRFRPVCGRA